MRFRLHLESTLVCPVRVRTAQHVRLPHLMQSRAEIFLGGVAEEHVTLVHGLIDVGDRGGETHDILAERVHGVRETCARQMLDERGKVAGITNIAQIPSEMAPPIAATPTPQPTPFS